MYTDPGSNNELDQSLKKAEYYSGRNQFKRWIPSIIILPLALYWVINRGEYGLLDNIDLVIHEAGHFLFSLFGKFIFTLGGTLMQIILPSVIAAFFFRNNYRTGVQFSLLWLGQNLINISVYAADARARKIPLLGGNKVYHDWNYLLGELGILEQDYIAGYIFLGLAIIIFIVAILMPLLTHD
ncbi:MAG: hypothetical protein ACHQLA_02775 [Ignavibacteriales bacterium]